MAKAAVKPIDLNFQGYPHAIASYMIEHDDGVILVESGPGSTLNRLETALREKGFELKNITHVLLTHIHLDHAGASGKLAQMGATICVHPAGAPHLIAPEKLLASATRIYGEKMESLWGEFLPVPENRIKLLQHEEVIEVNGLKFVALHTPGHAEHHICYLLEGICFSGDVGGVRIPGYPYLQAPMPPPELHFGKWYDTLALLKKAGIQQIAPTHFGIFDDPDWHLSQLERGLRATEKWLETVMPEDPPIDVLRDKFTKWVETDSGKLNMDEKAKIDYDLANPLGMSADGLQRYWRKYRQAG
jgi:glyoxylase-like metal-dependent hydrolase (beta-lactamase superfamily II)